MFPLSLAEVFRIPQNDEVVQIVIEKKILIVLFSGDRVANASSTADDKHVQSSSQPC